MGNCVFRRSVEDGEAIRVLTGNGGVMELDGPLTAECITNDYPAHRIFRLGNGITSHPLPPNEELLGGQLYYLLPHEDKDNSHTDQRLSSCASDHLLPRISTHTITTKSRKPCLEVLPKQRNGVWRVKLVITPEQLTEILSEESNTEALIESVRTVAKRGANTGFGGATPSNELGNCNNSWKPLVETLPEAVVEESGNKQMDRGI